MDTIITYQDLSSFIQKQIDKQINNKNFNYFNVCVCAISATDEKSVCVKLEKYVYHFTSSFYSLYAMRMPLGVASINITISEFVGNALLVYVTIVENDSLHDLHCINLDFLQKLLPIQSVEKDKVFVELNGIKKVRKFLKYNELTDIHVENEGIRIKTINRKKQH